MSQNLQEEAGPLQIQYGIDIDKGMVIMGFSRPVGMLMHTQEACQDMIDKLTLTLKHLREHQAKKSN